MSWGADFYKNIDPMTLEKWESDAQDFLGGYDCDEDEEEE